jgi:hypothetical protein
MKIEKSAGNIEPESLQVRQVTDFQVSAKTKRKNSNVCYCAFHSISKNSKSISIEFFRRFLLFYVQKVILHYRL